MAMKAMRCPQCGSDLELDDSKEFGFCSSCGTKIMLHETVQMKHSGAVHMKMDNSDQGHNRISLGNRAFESGNYQEAYEYFTKGLEDVPDDAVAIYRKGICAVCLCPEDNLRLSELNTGIRTANGIINEALDRYEDDTPEQDEVYDVIALMDADLENLGYSALGATDTYYNRTSNIDKCNYQAATWCETAKLLELVTDYMIAEEPKEKLLASAVERCDEWLGYDKNGGISYYTNTTTDKKGKSTDHYSVYRMNDARRQVILNARSSMAERYNNLPSRVERAQSMADTLNGLQEESNTLKSKADEAQSRYDAAKDAFWSSNPEHAARKAKQKNLSWISVGVGAVICLISFFLRAKLAIAPVIGVVLLIVSFFVKRSIVKKLQNKLEAEVFPSDIKQLGDELASAKAEWQKKEQECRAKQGEISEFEASKK